MQTAYAPADGVYAAFDKGFAIFLDLRRNRYLAAPVDALQASTTTPPSATVAALLNRGLIAPARTSASLTDWARTAPSQAVMRERLRSCPAVCGAGALVRFARACLWAEYVVRFGQLAVAQRGLKQRRARARRPAHLSDVARGEHLSQQSDLFDVLRPWWPRDCVCLADALALAHFLASAGLTPEIVFGVRARPFSAHCWVECQGEVLRDLTGQYASYAPICRL